MKIYLAPLFVVFTLLASHSVRAANWEVVASPNAGRQANSLSSVADVADNDVWAVGWAFNAQLNAYRTVTEHWNGTRWSLVRSPNATNGYNLLNGIGVVAANDVWAVGQAAIGSTYSTMIQHWNGAAWSIVPSPTVNDDILFGVDAVASNDVWAVGKSFQEAKTLTIHWNGSNWSIVPSPNGIGDNILFGVATIASNNVWAVGNAG